MLVNAPASATNAYPTPLLFLSVKENQMRVRLVAATTSIALAGVTAGLPQSIGESVQARLPVRDGEPTLELPTHLKSYATRSSDVPMSVEDLDRAMATVLRDTERLFEESYARLIATERADEATDRTMRVTERVGVDQARKHLTMTEVLSRQALPLPLTYRGMPYRPSHSDLFYVNLERRRPIIAPLQTLRIDRWNGSIRDATDARTCTVTTAADSGAGSLRACMAVAGNGDEIVFSSEAFPVERPTTIALQSPLPVIGASDLTIDGSQRGAVIDGSAILRREDRPLVGLDISGGRNVRVMGLQLTGFDVGIALHSGARGCTVGGGRDIEEGLLGSGNVLGGNRFGVIISGPSTSDNAVVGSLIGTTRSGKTAFANDRGVQIQEGATHNTIGAVEPALGNVISGNTEAGVVIIGSNSSQNMIMGNVIGADESGMKAIGNGIGGVIIQSGASDNIVGGTAHGAANVISGNGVTGVEVGYADAQRNAVMGNIIGLDGTGSVALGNLGAGVMIHGGAKSNTIGGSTNMHRNVISGNGIFGVYLSGPNTSGNLVVGNYVGIGEGGDHDVGNRVVGVEIDRGASVNIIGGLEPGSRNVISGNGRQGIHIGGENTLGNQVIGNLIGPKADGKSRMNVVQATGVLIDSAASENLIGPNNVISANELGVSIVVTDTQLNIVSGNLIGTDVSGRQMLSNDIGVGIGSGAASNRIGTPQEPNIISGNTAGVFIGGEGSNDNVVSANLIGTDLTGTMAIPNGAGVLSGQGALRTVIGGLTVEYGNLVSGNLNVGIGIGTTNLEISESREYDYQISSNRIGTNALGLEGVPNGVGVQAVRLSDVAIDDNVISGNELTGINISATHRVLMTRNRIGVGSDGRRRVGNGTTGIFLSATVRNSIGEGSPKGMNVIANSRAYGVVIRGSAQNTVSVNSIFDNRGRALIAPDSPVLPPVIESYDVRSHAVSGKSCSGCMVEIYGNSTSRPDMTTFIDRSQADDSGRFEGKVTSLNSIPFLVAIAQDANEVMSEPSQPFAASVRVFVTLPYLIKSLDLGHGLNAMR